jgi:molecular chaperone HtpG
MSSQRHEFQAEIKQLLDLMIHSLYSDRDIFLRELVSNASDALDKLRYLQASDASLESSGEPHIRISTDAAANTITISDNGVGMTRDEVVKNIGTIAKSGTKEFLAAAKAAQRKELTPELIGQFGVGFYSAFMVADKVEMLTRKVGQDNATAWTSTGDGSYEIADGERATHGTTITLQLKARTADAASDAGVDKTDRDYTQEWTIREIVRKYSDFVAYPIRMSVTRPKREDKTDANSDSTTSEPTSESTTEDLTLNSGKAIWDRAKGDVTDEEYKEFYRHISHDWQAPLRTIPVNIEGTIEARALMFLPSQAPADLYSPEMKRGLQLYVKRVFVMDECKELMPAHFRFIKGVVDAHDLSLNVSREILQKDRQIGVIKKQLVKKVMGALDDLKKTSLETYTTFWREFGPVIKEGLLSFDDSDHEKLFDLVMTHSTVKATDAAADAAADTKSNELTTLAAYVERMKPDQESIYVITGSSPQTAAKSPLLEAFAAKNIEVLMFTDPIDELWIERGAKFRGKSIVAVGRGEVKLGNEAEQKQQADELAEKQREFSDLLSCLRVHLHQDVKEVRVSNRMTSSAACLVTDGHAPSPRLARLLEQMGQAPEKVKPVLELNPSHAVVKKVSEMFKQSNSDPRLSMFAQLLYAQAALSDTGQIPNPDAFANALGDLMLRA